jgi:hypothetical protein
MTPIVNEAEQVRTVTYTVPRRPDTWLYVYYNVSLEKWCSSISYDTYERSHEAAQRERHPGVVVFKLQGEPPPNHIRDEHGVDHKVLGKPPTTKDGCVSQQGGQRHEKCNGEGEVRPFDGTGRRNRCPTCFGSGLIALAAKEKRE